MAGAPSGSFSCVQVKPPSVVANSGAGGVAARHTQPPAAQPVVASTKLTALSAVLPATNCGIQVAPPSVVCSIVTLAPAFQPELSC